MGMVVLDSSLKNMRTKEIYDWICNCDYFALERMVWGIFHLDKVLVLKIALLSWMLHRGRTGPRNPQSLSGPV